jgi:hypothetical protein
LIFINEKFSFKRLDFILIIFKHKLTNKMILYIKKLCKTSKMSFYKNFQQKNIQTQANTTFKYLLLTSVKNYTNSISSSSSQNQSIFRSKYQYFSFQFKKLLTSKAKSSLLFKKILQQPVKRTNTTNNIFIKTNNIVNRQQHYENNSKNLFNMFIATFTNISLFYSSLFNLNKSILKKSFILKINKKFQVQKMNFNNNYSCFKKWFIQKSLNVSKRFNLKINLNYTNNNNSKKKSSLYFASFSSLAMFSWDDYKINDQEVKNEVNEILSFFKDSNSSKEEKNQQDESDNGKKNDNNLVLSNHISLEIMRKKEDDEWKIIYDQPDIIIWRRNINLAEIDHSVKNESNAKIDYDLYEYKVLGKIDDINAIEFFQTQIDLKYRQEWFVIFLSK